jgi:hypothetical protein
MNRTPKSQRCQAERIPEWLLHLLALHPMCGIPLHYAASGRFPPPREHFSLAAHLFPDAGAGPLLVTAALFY